METSTTTVKTPPEESEPDNPTRPQPTKPLSFTNGVLKLRHAPPHAPLSPPGTYKECLKNHAAAMGGHAVDGCGEYMPSAASLLCAACNCHRNFHRRHSPPPPPPLLEYTPHHRHHPPPPPPRSPNSASPPPISSAYAPHMLLALSSGPNPNPNPSPRKRFRTKFTTNQKEKMFEFAEKLTWKMQRRDEDVINEFCHSIGVEKGVFKVWMHNNKNTLGGKKDPTAETNGNGGGINLDDRSADYHHRNRSLNMTIDEVNAHRLGGSNGSSSSS